MLEVFTIGGGEYIVNIFNAVAAWTGSGGYRSMLRVAMLLGFIFALMIVVFNLDWKAMIQWFLLSTLIYLGAMVPTTTIKVTDRVNPSLAPATIDNVPLGLGLIASFTSQVGDYLTRTSETIFTMPDALKYSTNGMIYGARLMESVRTIRIDDPEFAANMEEHMKQCVYYDIMLGFKSVDSLAKSTDIWSDIGPGSPARGQAYLTRTGTTVSSSVLTCEQAYTALDANFNTYLDERTLGLARRLYPSMADNVARTKLLTELPIMYQSITSSAANATEVMKQALAINAFQAARGGAAGTGIPNIDAFAATRADVQTQNSYSAIAAGAMKWVPVLNIVLTSVFYALFPIIFPLFLFPRTGPSALRGYTFGFFYLAAWGPLFAILHSYLSSRAVDSGNAVSAGGMSLVSQAGIGAVNNETATLAGYLIMFIPFLAAGMAKGATAIAGHSASFLGPAQSAGEAAGAEATTGNYSYANTQFQTSSANVRQSDQVTTAPTYFGGSASFSERQSNGSVETQFESGNNVVDQRPSLSNTDFSFNKNSNFQKQLSERGAKYFNQSESLSNSAQESFSASIGDSVRVFDTVQSSSGSETARGSSQSKALTTMQDIVDRTSEGLQSRLGISKSAADSFSRDAVIGANAGGGVSSPVGKAWMDANLRELASKSEGTVSDDALSSTSDFVTSEAFSDQARSANESFFRSVSTSSNQAISGATKSRDANLSRAQTFSADARKAEERGRRYELQADAIKSGSVGFTQRLDQQYVEFAREELANDHNLASSDYTPGKLARTQEQQDVQAILAARFSEQYIDSIGVGGEDLLREPESWNLQKPSSNTQAEVESWGAGNLGSTGGGGSGSRSGGGGPEDVSSEVDGRLEYSRERLSQSGRSADITKGDVGRQVKRRQGGIKSNSAASKTAQKLRDF